MSKLCIKCDTVKRLKFFSKDKYKKDGLQNYCKSCIKLYNKKYYIENKDKIINNVNIYKSNNKEKVKTYLKLYSKEWRNNNKSKNCHKAALYRTRKLNASNIADIENIKQAYKKCSEINKITGITHHVDHIIPLKGKDVCGLHVSWNLQIIKAEDNLKKGVNYR